MKKTIFLIFSLVACSGESPAENPDAERVWFVPDATGCDNARSDNYTDGECRCGDNPPCPAPLACRRGRCFTPDPDGDPCEFDDECPSGYSCIGARCAPTSCEEEVCDGTDNDCDGEVDENSDSSGPLGQWCPPGAPPLPPCRRGAQVCLGGEWGECLGAIFPQDEVGWFACDGIDNDCDGCVDAVMVDGECVEPDAFLYDTVFVVDVSGSMHTHIASLRNELALFSSVYSGRPEFRFALVEFPANDGGPYAVTTDFTSFALFDGHLSMLRTNGGGEEPSYDVTHDILTGDLPLAWRSGAVQIIIVLTDEAGQSYRIPRISESRMCSAAGGSEVLTFVSTPGVRGSFDECGQWFDLRTAFNTNLHRLIRNPCP